MRFEGKNFSATSSNNFLISCWSYLGENNNPCELFESYEERNDVAIMSSISKMEGFIEKYIYNNYKLFAKLEHKKVQYYKRNCIVLPQDTQMRADFVLDIIFKKEEDFSWQKEYRFALREFNLEPVAKCLLIHRRCPVEGYFPNFSRWFSSRLLSRFRSEGVLQQPHLGYLHSLIFYVNPKEYIEGVWVNQRKHDADPPGIIAALLANDMGLIFLKIVICSITL